MRILIALWLMAGVCLGQLPPIVIQNLQKAVKTSGAVGSITNVTGSLSNWWRFDDNGGTTATNAVVANAANTGTLGLDGGGANPTWVAGKIGGALSFDGVGSKVTLAANNPNGSVPCTISAWLYRTSANGTFLYDSDTDVQNGWFCYVSGGLIIFDVACSAQEMIVKATDTSSSSTWYHVVITWDGVISPATGVHIYINGTEASYTLQQNGNGSHGANTTGQRYIGRGAASESYYWSGNIDDVRVYGRALSSGEVNELYQWTGQP